MATFLTENTAGSLNWLFSFNWYLYIPALQVLLPIWTAGRCTESYIIPGGKGESGHHSGLFFVTLGIVIILFFIFWRLNGIREVLNAD